MATITNGENGLSVRNKLNAVLEKDLISSTWSALQTAYPDGGAALLALPVGTSVWVTDLEKTYYRNTAGTAWITQSDIDFLDQGTNRNIAATDHGKVIRCTAAITLTWPSGLSPQPSTIIIPPLTGVVTLATSSTTLNGSSGSLERSRGNNPAGVYVAPTATNAYAVSGT